MDLLYILGSGRSGSTVVERILNTAPKIVGVGEIHALWRLPIATLRCSCGASVTECSFWQDVLSFSGIGAPELRQLAILERSVVRNRYLARLRYDLAEIRADQRVAAFAALQSRLFAGVRRAGDGAIVLDSSKAGPRAWVLAATMQPAILHIYRGAEDVIASWRRPKFDPSTRAPMHKPSLAVAALDWVKAEQAARSLGKVTSVRRLNYRQFAEEPQTALRQALLDDFPWAVDAVSWTGPRTVRPSPTYHSVLGNPDRFDHRDITIAPQRASDRARFGPAERGLIGTLGKTLEWVYP